MGVGGLGRAEVRGVSERVFELLSSTLFWSPASSLTIALSCLECEISATRRFLSQYHFPSTPKYNQSSSRAQAFICYNKKTERLRLLFSWNLHFLLPGHVVCWGRHSRTTHWLKQQTLPFPQFWRTEVRDAGLLSAGLVFSRGLTLASDGCPRPASSHGFSSVVSVS